jgi:hypothetical protein
VELGSTGKSSCLCSRATSTTTSSHANNTTQLVPSLRLSSQLGNKKQVNHLEADVSDNPGNYPTVPTSKRVKRGFKGLRKPLVGGVIFESAPTWLWALRLSEFSKLAITQECELELRASFTTTWDHVSSKLVPIKQSQIASTPVDIWFVSGSRRFVESLAINSGAAVATWLYPTGRSKPPNLHQTSWVKLAHNQVGGVTNVTGTFGIRNLAPFIVEIDPIARTIAHIIKHSERPVPCCPSQLEFSHYRTTDRLSSHLLDRPVLMPTSFSRTGWGHRALIPSELGHAYELPPFVLWDDSLRGRIVPIQLLRVVADHVLDDLAVATRPYPTSVEPAGGVSKMNHAAGSVFHEDAVLLRCDRWLAGSWADVAIAGRAVKADNARIDFSPWNRRISLVFPRCSGALIEVFESFGLRWWRRSLTQSFLAHLRHSYGADWAERARRGRNLTSSVKRPWVSTEPGAIWESEPSSPVTKRVCLARGVVTQEGGSMGLLGQNASRVALRANDFDGRNDLDDLQKDLDCGRAVLSQILSGSWWDWCRGSALIFWRWNGKEQARAARDGMEIFVHSRLPRGRKSKQVKLEARIRQLVGLKIEGMLERSYLETGFVSNALHYFAVPKGDTDIRVVFDGTSSGLNETLWAPNFYLPTAKAAALHISFSSWMADMDCGEMFHNFFMDHRVRKCAGLLVDGLGTLGKGNKAGYLRWSRLFMGMKSSPYNAVRHYYWAEEFAKGDPSLVGNPMAFDTVILNLPGMTSFDPALPKVLKWNTSAHAIAGDVITFVDDVRVTGYSKENCRDVHHQFASRIQFLGMQDAPRKFRPPSQSQAGAWTGTIFRISSDSISKSVSEEKWAKGRAIIDRLRSLLGPPAEERPMLCRKLLERETGFLNHLAMTFENLTPFLKGFYLSLNSWRSGRDAEDWKVSDKTWMKMLEGKFYKGEISDDEFDASWAKAQKEGAPHDVKASPRLADDVGALHAIFYSSKDPPRVNLRSKKIVTAIYGFGDASGTGLGATFTCGAGFTFRIGVWGTPEQSESSNWKEFTNVVESLEEEGNEGNLANAEVFMFTDNSTVEACAEKGSSSSRKLLDLIIRLQALSTRLGIRIHIFHVAGTRMIAQGTDGVSRGYLSQGVMAGDSMLVHIPIYLSAIDRAQGNLLPWIRSWTSAEASVLSPFDWFQLGHDIAGWTRSKDGFSRPRIINGTRTYIWAPPPFAAEVAIAELRKARIKRQMSSHVFICPRLCTTLWQRQLFKCADIVFEVPVGSKVWPSDMHEPLLIGLLFPFLRVKPWQLRGTPKMHAVGRELRGLFADSEVDPGNFLRKFWITSLGLKHMPEKLVRKMLYFE